MDFPSVNLAMDAVVKMYEHKLRDLNPKLASETITYDIAHLYEFLDSLHDICALVLDHNTNQYNPHDKAWIKNKIFSHLRGQATK